MANSGNNMLPYAGQCKSIYSVLPNTRHLESNSCNERLVPLAACIGYPITSYTLPNRALLLLVLLVHFLRLLLSLINLLSFHLYVSTLRDSTVGKPDRRHFEAIVTLFSLWRFNRLHSRLFYSTRKTLHTEFTKNGLTETYFCNKKQNESNMAEGVFLTVECSAWPSQRDREHLNGRWGDSSLISFLFTFKTTP